jgi:CheY-like chemotaxis protein
VRLPAVHGDSADAGPSHRLKAATPGRRLRVLAIDDEALLLKAYRRMLIDHHDVEVRVGAREALRLLEADRAFDIVLCDLQMPDMSGADLYGVVRERWPELAERFIFITGGAFSPDARKFLEEAQPPACINKPFHVNELLDLMERRVTATPPPAIVGQRADGGATR